MTEDKRKSKIGDDPFAGLPRRQLYAHEKFERDNALRAPFVDKPVTKPAGTNETKPAGTKPRGGRPSIGEPWIAAGMSRSAWFRKKKSVVK